MKKTIIVEQKIIIECESEEYLTEAIKEIKAGIDWHSIGTFHYSLQKGSYRIIKPIKYKS